MTLRSQKRIAILDAAINEFREKGVQGTSMDALAARAGVSKRTVYNHFSSKDALFETLVTELVEYLHRPEATSFHPDESLQQQLIRIAEDELAMFRDQRFLDLAKLLMIETAHSDELAAGMKDQLEKTEGGMEAWVQAALDAGMVHNAEPARAKAQFVGLLKAEAFWPQLLMGFAAPDEAHRQKIIQDAVAMFIARYGKESN